MVVRWGLLGVWILAGTLSGCGGDDQGLPETTVSGPAVPTDDGKVRYLIVAADESGLIDVFQDTGGQSELLDIPIAGKNVSNENGLPLVLGEVVIAGTQSLVVATGGVISNGVTVGGGLVQFNLNELAEHAAGTASDGQHHGTPGLNLTTVKLPAASGSASLPDHTLLSAEGQHLWVSNEAGSIFRVNIDADDTEDTDGSALVDDMYLNVAEIVTGAGHQRSTLASPSGGSPMLLTHHADDQAISVVDLNPAAATFMTVSRTINLGADNIPHGMTYSPLNHNVYVGIESGPLALGILDATDNSLAPHHLVAGAGAGQIPVGGTVAVDLSTQGGQPAGRWIFSAGYRAGVDGTAGLGFLSVIDASMGNAVVEVVPLGDANVGTLHISHLTVNNQARTRLFLGTVEGGTDDHMLRIVDLDPATGKSVNVATLHVGVAMRHRPMALSSDGRRLYVAHENDCGTGGGHHGLMNSIKQAGHDMTACGTIAVVDVAMGHVVSQFKTSGNHVAGLGVYALPGVPPLDSATPAPPVTTPPSTDTGGGHH